MSENVVIEKSFLVNKCCGKKNRWNKFFIQNFFLVEMLFYGTSFFLVDFVFLWTKFFFN